MVRKLFCSMCVMGVVVAFAAADDYSGVITKIDGNKITFQKMTKGKKGMKGEKDGDPVTLTVNSDTKIVSAKFAKGKMEDGDEVKDGLKNEIFAKIDADTGVRANITTKGDSKVAEKIQVFTGKKKGGGAE
jgi:hypothetical protein